VTTTVLAPAPRRRFGRRERDWRKDTPRLRPGRLAIVTTLVTLVLAGSVFGTMTRGAGAGAGGIGILVFLAFIIFSIKHPRFSVLGIVVWVPLQEAVLAYAFHKGAPLVVVRGLGYLKEFWEISLVVVALRGVKGQPRRRFDPLDRIAFAYVGLSTFYLIFPSIIHGTLGGLPFGVRLNAWRLEAIYVVLFLAVRQLSFDKQFVRDLRKAAMLIGVVIAAFAIWESIDNHGFNNFLANTLDYPAYRLAITGVGYADPSNLLASTSVGNAAVTRAGSLFNDPLTLGFFCLIPFGIALERLSAKQLSYLAMFAAGGTGAAILLSETRSAVLGAGLAGVLAVIFASRMAPGRFRLLVVVAAVTALALPSASHSSLRARFEGIFTGTRDSDSQEHVTASKGAFIDVTSHPVGRGLGANTSTGTRYNTSNATTAEDSYLETGEELGLAGALLYLVLLCALLVKLRARSKQRGVRAELAGGMWLAGMALLLGGFFLQVWLELDTSLVFWVLAAVALTEPTGDESADELGIEDAAWGSHHRRLARSL
jgi:hypothetical protein